jgi:radical SAM superfamily enzyme YgiQ (UPF0313 family)
MNNKIMLIAFNARYTHSNLALYNLRTSLLASNYEVEIHEFTIHDDLFQVLQKLADASPGVIGISVYIWNTLYVKLLLLEIKKVIPDVKIILGGPEVSYNAEQWLDEFPMIDYIVCGAGETAIRRLAECNFEYADKIVSIPNPDFSTIPFPYLPSDKELLKHKYVYYEASRGCPFQCSYCLSSRDDQELKFRDIETIKSELRQLWEFEPFIIKFIDRSFNVNQLCARQIWQFLINESPDIMYHFEIHPLYLEEEDFDILKYVVQGRFQFEIGIQSIHPETIKEIGRTGEWEKIKPKLERLRQFKQIHQHYDAIVGLPYETKEKLGETVSELLTLKPDHLQLGFLKILPGTAMSEKTTEYEMQYQSNPPYRVLSTKWMSFSEIQSCEHIETILNAYVNSGHFKYIVDECFEVESGKAFERLEDFVFFILVNNEDLRTKDWLKKAKTLRSYCLKAYPQKIEYFDELLLWDWCVFPSNLAYPEFLPIHLLNAAKQESLVFLRNLPADHLFWKDNDLKLDDIKRAHFYKATSLKVQEQCLAGKTHAMIFKQQGHVKTIYYNIDFNQIR